LRDLLALAAGELLPRRLDDLPLTRDDLQGLRNVLTELRQLGRAAAGATGGGGHNDTFARQMFRKRLAGWPLALESPDTQCLGNHLCRELVLASISFEFFELQLHLFEKPRLALRATAVQLPSNLL